MKFTYLILALSFSLTASSQNLEATNKTKQEYTTETIVSDRVGIWGMKVLPNGDMIFTERSGKIGILSMGKVTEIKGVPKVAYESQGGLLDITLHPKYSENGWIYTTYLENSGENSRMNLIRFKIENNTLTQIQNIHSTSATNKWRGHNGSRILFDNNGLLYWSVGEGGSTSRGGKNSPNKNAQNVKESWGKVHRMNDDGTVPADNPILPGNTVATTVYTYGNRNPQGLALNPSTNQVYETEHGPRGGDELNLLKPGANYGWPIVSYGVNYDNVDISGKKHDGYEEPLHQWTPSIGACGLAYVTSDFYPEWKGSLLAGGLALNHISRVSFDTNGKAQAEVLFENIGRVRDIIQGADGFIYVSLEGPGRIVKILPKK